MDKGVRIALVGRAAYGRIHAASHLRRKHKFKVLRLDDGVQKFVRYMYYYKPHQRVTWETRLRFYDAMYKEDNDIHIGYLLRRLASIPPEQDVVIPDPRYINEVEQIIAQGFKIVRVTDPPGYKPVRMAGMKHAASGTVKLQEAYGRARERYPVDYSVSNDDYTKLCHNFDKILAKEREKILNS